ncbi:hypothetical protein SLEP1_g56010 [Rubroshorea leprosula]|uniref:RNase H type-1 domain-containing protein n=1 Tax=Rubroshorea leprosula TaxID=152421 RepID=A0AAV5MI91_9ROSI|nr:hypothetical protein SLEP1_g56010 [Rubroshorea leprosula]
MMMIKAEDQPSPIMNAALARTLLRANNSRVWSMKIISWNCRGAAKQSFQSSAMDLKRIHNPCIMLILETKISEDHAIAKARALGFPHFHCVDSDGLAGGLWILWNDSKVTLDIVSTNAQAIHAIVKVRNHPSLSSDTWFLSGIYGRPVYEIRTMLWQELRYLSIMISCSWILIGDFNDVIDQSKIFGVALCAKAGERLDRAWANPDWRLIFSEANLYHLPRFNSDHHPIMLDLCPNLSRMGPRPFRMEKFWLDHHDFNQAISHIWLNGIYRAPTFPHSSFLVDLERQLSKEYENILMMEEDLWFMKSRSNWLIEGDRNTKFFHLSTICHKARNRILGLKDSTGNWIFDPLALSTLIMNYFSGLFTTSHELSYSDSFASIDVSLRAIPLESLQGVPTKDEIWATLHSIKPFKAPGPDDVHPLFFQKFWDITKDKLCTDIIQNFSNGIIPSSWNESLVVLIPKNTSPISIQEFRPIGLLKGSKAGRRGPLLSHLFFADDIIFVGKATQENCNYLSSLLQFFCSRSGQKINLQKSRVLFSNNVDPPTRDLLCSMLGISKTKDLGKYLGRVTLTKSVLEAVPNYYMQSSLLPTSIHRELDQISRNFIWGSDEHHKKIHLRLHIEKDKLWSKIFCYKYSIMDPRAPLPTASSPVIKGLQEGRTLFQQGLKWIPRNGNAISFWNDYWCGDRPLSEIRAIPLSLENLDTAIFTWAHGQGGNFSSSSAYCLLLELPSKDAKVMMRPSTISSGPAPAISLWNDILPGAIVSNDDTPFLQWLRNNSTRFDDALTTPIPQSLHQRTHEMFAWSKPHFPTIKLNSDGSFIGNPGLSRSGGIFRDSLGNWVLGYARNIGFSSPLAAELWAIRDGLVLAIQKGFHNLIVESDSKVVVLLLTKGCVSTHPHSTLILDCKMLMQKIHQIHLVNIVRERNMCANQLAKMGMSLSSSFCIFEFCPPAVVGLCLANAYGVQYVRPP